MSATRAVTVFWDYENCPVPSNATGYSIANNIYSLAHPFGVVKINAYLEIDKFKTGIIRSELQTSGVSLVDCPHNGRKDVADKIILVDMMAYAIDNPAPRTIILITGDRDFAYALSSLKHRRYQVVLVRPPNAHASLVSQASIIFDWFDDVVNKPNAPSSQFQQRIQEAETLEVSNEAWPSPGTMASDLSDGEESDYAYRRKKTQRDIHPAYSTGNTRAPHSPSKNSSSRAHLCPISSKPRNSYHIALESNIMFFDEDQAPMDAYSGSKSNFGRTNRNPREEESNRRIPPLLGRLRSPEIERSRSPSSSPSDSELSSPSTSPRLKEEDDELERYRPFVIPKIYNFLVKILQNHRKRGIEQSYRSVIAGKISVEHIMYRTVGITTFDALMDHAERDGIVRLGGDGVAKWVRLMPDWFDAVSYKALNTC